MWCGAAHPIQTTPRTPPGQHPTAEPRPPHTCRYQEGMYGAPTGLYMLIDHSSLTSSDWSIIQLAYNGQGPFSSPDDLAAQFNSGALAVLNYPRPVTNDPARPVVTSMRRRGPARPLEARPLPFTYQPGCPRFAVSGSQISWLSWDFAIGFEIVGGITFNDVRFRGQRVVYELSLQDAYAAYSGSSPLQSLAQYSGALWSPPLPLSLFPLRARPPGAAAPDARPPPRNPRFPQTPAGGWAPRASPSSPGSTAPRTPPSSTCRSSPTAPRAPTPTASACGSSRRTWPSCATTTRTSLTTRGSCGSPGCRGPSSSSAPAPPCTTTTVR